MARRALKDELLRQTLAERGGPQPATTQEAGKREREDVAEDSDGVGATDAYASAVASIEQVTTNSRTVAKELKRRRFFASQIAEYSTSMHTGTSSGSLADLVAGIQQWVSHDEPSFTLADESSNCAIDFVDKQIKAKDVSDTPTSTRACHLFVCAIVGGHFTTSSEYGVWQSSDFAGGPPLQAVAKPLGALMSALCIGGTREARARVRLQITYYLLHVGKQAGMTRQGIKYLGSTLVSDFSTVCRAQPFVSLLMN